MIVYVLFLLYSMWYSIPSLFFLKKTSNRLKMMSKLDLQKEVFKENLRFLAKLRL